MTTTTLRLPDGAVYVTREQEREQPVSKSETPAEQRGLASLGATVIRADLAKEALKSALEAEAAKLEKAAIDLGPGHQDMKEIYRAKAAGHRARLAELTTGAQPAAKPQTITIDRKAVR